MNSFLGFGVHSVIFQKKTNSFNDSFKDFAKIAKTPILQRKSLVTPSLIRQK